MDQPTVISSRYGNDDFYCALCGNKLSDFKKVVKRYDTKTGNPAEVIEFKECHSCGSGAVLPNPTYSGYKFSETV
jgi:hypothetical protein